MARRVARTPAAVAECERGIGVGANMNAGFDRSIVESTGHRPWPMPSAPWIMTQSWNSLLFAHWRVDASQVRRLVPGVFDLDLFDGEAWLGVVPFNMTNVGVRAAPALPWLSAFPELNVRTYVRVSDRPGVGTFSAWMPGDDSPSRRRGRYSTCRTMRR